MSIGCEPIHVVPCPACKTEAKLSIKGDGLGGIFISCAGCNACGPSVAISGDFDRSDAKAIRGWSAWATPHRTARASRLARDRDIVRQAMMLDPSNDTRAISPLARSG